MKLEKSTRNAIYIPLFTRHGSEISIKLSITPCDLSVNRNVSRCHAALSTLRQVRFDGRIIRLSRLLIRSRFPGAARILFRSMRLHLAVAAELAHPIMVLDTYSLVSFPEVQTLDISKMPPRKPAHSRETILFLSVPIAEPTRSRKGDG